MRLYRGELPCAGGAEPEDTAEARALAAGRHGPSLATSSPAPAAAAVRARREVGGADDGWGRARARR
eukprot:14987202-Alexandrium_andersonii.AAC.1